MVYLLKLLEVLGLKKPVVKIQEFKFAILDEDQMEEAVNQLIDDRKMLIRLVMILSVTILLLIGGLFLSFKLGYDSNITIWVPPTENIGNQE